MSIINPNYSKLQAGYLFPEIAKRTKIYKEQNPTAKIIKLGIGDTTMPLGQTIISAMAKAVENLGQKSSYSGYGDSEGSPLLRQAISDYYKDLNCKIDVNEVFMSDGAKSDCANIQSIFGDSIVALQDPAYPVYVDSNVIAGRTGNFNEQNQFDKLVYLECAEANNFVAIPPTQKADLIYLCYPNNPTGAMATRSELQQMVNYAIANKAVIIYDAAYSWFITDASYPKSIYEISGSDTCAIEINSFSKWAGFTGVRLGWTVVPKTLITENTTTGELNKAWNRRQNTFFNGACNIAQAGGLASLSLEGRLECQKTIDYYMENATIIRTSLQQIGFVCFGGQNAPYIWLQTPLRNGQKVKSWDFFDELLDNCQVVGTPGSGFGTAGEGYFRFSAFGNREDIITALERICNFYN